MYDGYNYTSKFGMMLKNDYKKYAARQGTCYYDSTKIAFKNVDMIEEDGLSNEKLKELVS